MGKKAKISHLIVDSGAFIANSDIQNIGETIITLPEVIAEIKDENTRNRLQVLSYEINYREPSAEDMKFVIDFAHKTGDYSQLSVTDLKLIALTYRIEKEQNGGQHLRDKPIQAKVVQNSASLLSGQTFAGFAATKNENKKDESDVNDKEIIDQKRDERKSEIKEDNEEENDDEEEVDDVDDDEGWITPNNVDEIRQQMLGLKVDDELDEKVSVGCLTGDFAMQNVLMQIGLKVISIRDGLCIRETKQFALRCHACFKISTNNSKQFCQFCGNQNTLKRVSITLRDDGSRIIHINYKKPINIRGTRFSLPAPKSGKHVNNPVVVADQPIPQHKKSKLFFAEKKQLNANNILKDPDYVNRLNPFAVNDVYSRSSRITTNSRRAPNPNETRKSTGNRKKKNK